jgi:hypothetical protein
MASLTSTSSEAAGACVMFRTLTPAEALRRAMVAMLDDPSRAQNAHPGIWAPFVIVGTTARVRQSQLSFQQSPKRHQPDINLVLDIGHQML